MLGVPRDADAAAVKDAFRKLALRHHPDRNKEPGAEERFKEIPEAYAVLSDPKKRAEYDARGFAGVAGFTPEDLFGLIDVEVWHPARRVLRVRGKGLPEFGGKRRGDLYLRLRVQIPTRVAAEERRLYEQLRALGTKRKRAKP